MADVNGLQGPTGYEVLENLVLLAGTAAFLTISACFLWSLRTQPGDHPALRISLGLVSFVFALICFTSSPANQGRTLRRLLERVLPQQSSVDDLAKLQLSVGTAGFFNRIGLTGVPLAVALLALIFCGLALLVPRIPGNENLATALMDLTKLTVGAFIGALTKTRTSSSKDS